MIRFTLVSGKIYEVTIEEWLALEKWIKEIATIICEDCGKNIQSQTN